VIESTISIRLHYHSSLTATGIFKSGDPVERAKAIVHAVAHFRDGKKLAEVRSQGEASLLVVDVMMLIVHLCSHLNGCHCRIDYITSTLPILSTTPPPYHSY